MPELCETEENSSDLKSYNAIAWIRHRPMQTCALDKFIYFPVSNVRKYAFFSSMFFSLLIILFVRIQIMVELEFLSP
jgi:hypothetical protein